MNLMIFLYICLLLLLLLIFDLHEFHIFHFTLCEVFFLIFNDAILLCFGLLGLGGLLSLTG